MGSEQIETLKQHALRLLQELLDCEGGMCAHCIGILSGELQPLLETADVAAPATSVSAEVGGWLPIESAPKYQTVLVYFPDNDGGFMQLFHDDETPFFWYENTPTHWMPLPSPPTESLTPDSSKQNQDSDS